MHLQFALSLLSALYALHVNPSIWTPHEPATCCCNPSFYIYPSQTPSLAFASPVSVVLFSTGKEVVAAGSVFVALLWDGRAITAAHRASPPRICVEPFPLIMLLRCGVYSLQVPCPAPHIVSFPPHRTRYTEVDMHTQSAVCVVVRILLCTYVTYHTRFPVISRLSLGCTPSFHNSNDNE